LALIAREDGRLVRELRLPGVQIKRPFWSQILTFNFKKISITHETVLFIAKINLTN